MQADERSNVASAILNEHENMLESLEQFSRKLADSGLMSSEQVESFCETLEPDQKPHAADELSRKLVEKEVLTKYQVDTLSSGSQDPLVVGDYVVLQKVGEGGMGVVFKAHHQRMKRLVALKMISAAVGKDVSASRRFEREVEIAAKLNHPNIVAALDAREEQGEHYLIMEFVEGRALSAIVEDNGTLPVAVAIDYVLQAAAGIAHAHGLGVIHRDIKPSNLMVGRGDIVKILDMGLARVELPTTNGDDETLSHLTNAGIIMGTVDYVSPEQALDSRNVDHRTDIYSLGCTLYFLLVGHPIYEGETSMQKIIAHREQPVPSLCAARGDVTPTLDAICKRMVAKKVDERFQTMSDVIQALQTMLGEVAPKNSPIEQVRKEDVLMAEVVEDSNLRIQRSAEAVAQHNTVPEASVAEASGRRELKPTGYVQALDKKNLSRLIFCCKLSSAIICGVVGLSVGDLVPGPVGTIAGLFYIWFGWRIGGGYARSLAYLIGWSKVPPETASGKLFEVEKLKMHAAAALIGGIVGVATGGLWRGVLLGLTILALADRLRAK